MSGKKGYRLMEFWVSEDVQDILLKASVDKDIELNHVLSAIVREWASGKEIDPLKAPLKVSNR